MTREEAIKTLRELWRETNDPWYEEVYTMAIEALSAERTGEWVDRDGWSYCSNCGGEATPQNNGCEIEPCRTLFCQWCGAKMD